MSLLVAEGKASTAHVRVTASFSMTRSGLYLPKLSTGLSEMRRGETLKILFCHKRVFMRHSVRACVCVRVVSLSVLTD